MNNATYYSRPRITCQNSCVQRELKLFMRCCDVRKGKRPVQRMQPWGQVYLRGAGLGRTFCTCLALAACRDGDKSRRRLREE